MTTFDLSSGDPLADRRADYAKAFAEAGDFAAAADLMRQALELVPGWATGWNALADHLDEAGDRAGAAGALRRALEIDPIDASGSGAKLAAMGEAAAPGTLPPAFVRTLFDQYAPRFEAQLRDRLAYRAPELLLEAIQEARALRFGSALDLGCGTGLMGELLRARCDRLAGLDLSPAMLAKARAKGIYDALHEADILGFDAETRAFDIVTAADVLNYIGDLAPVFARVASWLRPGGLFAFTVEAYGGSESFVIRNTMRYAHSPEAVSALLAEAGLTLLSRRPATLREDRGAPVEGWLFAARFEGTASGLLAV